MKKEQQGGRGHRVIVGGLGSLALLAMVLGSIYCLMALLFFGNFRLEIGWHFFVLIATFAAPVVALAGFFVFCRAPGRATMLVSLAGSMWAWGLVLLWQAEGSSGLIH